MDFAPDAGRILLGGTDIATLEAAAVRARIGWLSQTTHLFDDSIRNNLRLARPDAGDAALWAALEQARKTILRHYLDEIDCLGYRLSLSSRRTHVSEELRDKAEDAIERGREVFEEKRTILSAAVQAGKEAMQRERDRLSSR